MSDRTPTARLRTRLLVAVCLAMTCPHGHGAGLFTTRAQLHQPQGPLAEKALEALAERTVDLQRELLAKHMDLILEEMKEPLQVTAGETEALKTSVEAVIKEAAAAWKPCMVEGLRPALIRYGEDAAKAARAATWTPEQIVPGFLVQKWTPPEWLPSWDKAVETHLGADRAARWKTLREEKRKAMMPAIEKAVQSWVDIARKDMDESFADHLRVMETAAGLPPEQTQKLVALSRKVVDEHVEQEKEAGRDMLLNAREETRKAFLSGRSMNSLFAMPPANELESVWAALARPVVGEAAMQKWKAAKEQKNQDLATRRQKVLEPSRVRARTQLEDQMAQEVEGLAASLNLDPERRKKVEALGKEAVAQSLELAVKGWLKSVESWTDDYLESRKSVYFSANTADQPTRLAVWQDGLKQLFTASELKLVQESAADRKTRAGLALARAALAEADPLLALTAEQRRALEPLVAPQMTHLIREDSKTWRVEVSQLQTAARLPEKQVRDILDQVQMPKWLRMGQNSPEQLRTAARNAPVVAKIRRDRTPAEFEQAVEGEVSSHLHQRSLKQREEKWQLMLAQVEDARRVLNLGPERTERLVLAAKGAVEADMASWRRNMEAWTRSQISTEVPPEALKAMLASLETNSFSFTMSMMGMGGPSQQEVWTHTVEEQLSKSERSAWDREVAERKAYKASALAGMAVLELDRRRRLAPQQCAKLEKILAAVVEDYLPEIESSMSSRFSPWHLSYYSCLMPLAGAKKADLQEVLTPAQWKQVREQDIADAERYWNSIESRRKMRDQIKRNNAIMPMPPMIFFAP